VARRLHARQTHRRRGRDTGSPDSPSSPFICSATTREAAIGLPGLDLAELEKPQPYIVVGVDPAFPGRGTRAPETAMRVMNGPSRIPLHVAATQTALARSRPGVRTQLAPSWHKGGSPIVPIGSRYDADLHKRLWARTGSNRRPLVCKSEPDGPRRFTRCHSVFKCVGQRLVRVRCVHGVSGCFCPSWHTLGPTGVFSPSVRRRA
jgi:hypothetical protein